MTRPLTQAVVEEWVALASGQFNIRAIWAELGIESYEGKHHLRTILQRLETKRIIARTTNDGSFRCVDSDLKEMG